MLGRVILATALLLLPSPKDVRKTSRWGSVVIGTVDRVPGKGRSEAVLTFYDLSGEKLCAIDYSSNDGSHGFGVRRSEWTSDGRFFIWNMGSSGGHQPWHIPTAFFDAKTSKVQSLDAYGKSPGITTDFRLSGRDSVEVQFLRESKPRRYSLSELVESRRDVPETSCAHGANLKF